MRTVAVIGAGTMGRGIAQATALAGYDVILYDIADDLLTVALEQIKTSIDKGVSLGKVEERAANRAKEALILTTALPQAAGADLIVEAAPEKLELKRDIFRQLDGAAPPDTIFATNTSSLSINALAAASGRPNRFLGLHFFNPAHIMKLVELIPGSDTSDETVAQADEYVARMGKTAVHCQDRPAFIVNRVARPFYGEALRMLGEDVADAAAIDTLLKSAGFPMGPFELIDLIGADVNFAVTKSVYEAYFHEPKYRPHPIQQGMVESERLGRKTGRGFYKYDD